MQFSPFKRNSGFTLLEVILAVALATGILIAMLLFYRQAADLRTQLLQETDRLTSFRLVMDRIAADLRSAYTDNEFVGLTGDNASLEFVRIDLPSLSAWSKSEAQHPLAQSDLRLVSYSSQMSLDGTNLVTSGLVRVERPLTPVRAIEESSPKTAEGDTPSTPASEPLTDTIRYLRFRYWDGKQWLDSWNDVGLPHGLEVTLATESIPEETVMAEYQPEVFRRVIYLPAHTWNTASISGSDLLPTIPGEGMQ